MSRTCDIFFSYRRMDLARAQPLLDALSAAGLRVWLDTTSLPDNAGITPEIRRGLAASKALVALYSLTYPLSRACQEEITAAWLAAQQMGEPPYGRVLAINPEDRFDHLLRSASSSPWAGRRTPRAAPHWPKRSAAT